MAKPKAPTTIRKEVGELKKLICAAVGRIRDSKKERQAVNADISADVETLEAQGIPRRALKMAMEYAEWDDDARAGFDVAYALVRSALGVPFEDQLFDAEGQPNIGLLKVHEPDQPKEAKGKKGTAIGETAGSA